MSKIYIKDLLLQLVTIFQVYVVTIFKIYKNYGMFIG